MRIVGLTGGIGSGKSTVAEVFKTIGIPVFNSDEQAKIILLTNREVIDAVEHLLGEDVLINGVPDRKRIAEKVFNRPELLNGLNAIIHPEVGEAFHSWCEMHVNKAPYVIKEAAILFESGASSQCDRIVLVVAPESTRISRVLKRDGAKEEDVRARMAHQWTDERKKPLSNFVVTNDGEAPVIPQVLNVHRTLAP